MAPADVYRSIYQRTGPQEPLAIGHLASSKADHRRVACAALGQIGSKRHLKHLKIVATSDMRLRM